MANKFLEREVTVMLLFCQSLHPFCLRVTKLWAPNYFLTFLNNTISILFYGLALFVTSSWPPPCCIIKNLVRVHFQTQTKIFRWSKSACTFNQPEMYKSRYTNFQMHFILYDWMSSLHIRLEGICWKRYIWYICKVGKMVRQMENGYWFLSVRLWLRLCSCDCWVKIRG